jgi:putative tricarboxylic transport membrane protein
MEALYGIGHGFLVALSLQNLYYCFIGVLWGTIVGVLPGVGPLAGTVLLLPATFGIQPTAAIIMMAGIYYGAMYGGSTTSILMNIPGEAASVVTCLDGYRMARNGRPGAALFISAWGSFVGGNLAVCGIAFMAPVLAQFALRFGPAEMFSLTVLAMLIVGALGRGSALKTTTMVVLGLFLGTIGMDTMTGFLRMTYGISELADGIGFIPVAMGLFGVAEILVSTQEAVLPSVIKPKLRELLPTREELGRSWGPILRGSALGFFIGLMPGSAHIISSFASYAIEKKLSKHPEKFGTGMIEGVAGPETANNAATGGAMIPFLSLGIPSSPGIALMMMALLIHGVQPGPLLVVNRPDIFWGVIASMYIGNVMLIILNLPLVGMFVNLLRIPFRLLFPLILIICLTGIYSVNASRVELAIMLIFGVIGLFLRRFGFDGAPLVMALIIGPMMELYLRQSLMLSGGSPLFFLDSTIATVLLSVTVLLIVGSILFALLKQKEKRAPERAI